MVLRALFLPFGIFAAGFAQSASNAPATLAVHLVVACSSNARQPLSLPGVEPSLCLDRTPFLTQKDVQSAELRKNSKGHPQVFLTFHEDAAIRELEITHKNIGSRVGILVNGIVVSAPTIAAASRFVYIDANFTEKQAQALVAAFNQRSGTR